MNVYFKKTVYEKIKMSITSAFKDISNSAKIFRPIHIKRKRIKNSDGSFLMFSGFFGLRGYAFAQYLNKEYFFKDVINDELSMESSGNSGFATVYDDEDGYEIVKVPLNNVQFCNFSDFLDKKSQEIEYVLGNPLIFNYLYENGFNQAKSHYQRKFG